MNDIQGLLKNLMLGKQQMQPGAVVGQHEGQDMMGAPTLGARQGGLLEGLGQGMSQASGLGGMAKLAGAGMKRLGLEDDLAGLGGGQVGNMMKKVGRFF